MNGVHYGMGTTEHVLPGTRVRRLLSNYRDAVAEAHESAGRLCIGRNVRLLFGPYKGRMARITSVSFSDRVWLFVDNISTADGKDTISNTARRDGRCGYELIDVEIC